MNTLELHSLVRLRELAKRGDARRIRETARLSLSEIAAAIPVEVSTLARWEVGDRRPRGESALRWLEILDGLAATHETGTPA